MELTYVPTSANFFSSVLKSKSRLSLLSRCTNATHRKQSKTYLRCTQSARFLAAVEKGIIVDRGASVPLSSTGTLKNRRRHSPALSKPWKPVVDAIIEHVLRIDTARNSVYAVFVRGSVASGFAVPGISDVDLVIYCHPAIAGKVQALRENISQQVCRQYKLPTKVDYVVVPLPREQYSARDGPLPYSLLLQAFGRCVYGDDFLRTSHRGRIEPEKRAANILRDKSFAIGNALANYRNSNLQGELASLQWFTKRALRLCAELNWRKSKRYSRDLVPCYRICMSYMPEWEDILTSAIILICIRPMSWQSEMHISRAESYDCVAGIACLVEELYLREAYSKKDFVAAACLLESCRSGSSGSSKNLEESASRINQFNEVSTLESLKRRFLSFKMKWIPRRSRLLLKVSEPSISVRDLLNDALPEILVHSKQVATRYVCQSTDSFTNSCILPVDQVVTPVVYAGLVSEHVRDANDSNWRYSPSALSVSPRVVDVRVSGSNIFTFCRSSHPLISKGAFTPTSVLIKLSEGEFLDRCLASAERRLQRKPLAFRDGKERLYLQSEVPRAESILHEYGFGFKRGKFAKQRERVWISTAGTISSLHYDISYSIIAQLCGRKRMIFFPPSCLETLGIYPMGHPLHRRARVDITSNRCTVNAAMFSEFWKTASTVSQIVLLNPGDVCVFPPGWCHYTESLTWSVSRTIRH